MKVLWTEQSLGRLQEIEEYLSERAPETASRFIDRLIDRGARAGLFPQKGRRVPELGSDSIREVLEGSYRIVYRINPRSIEILTVFEGHRLIPLEDFTE